MFKVGDRVVCAEVIQFLSLTKTYEVEAVSRDADGPAYQEIRLKGELGWYPSRRFKSYIYAVEYISQPLRDYSITPTSKYEVTLGKSTTAISYGEDLKPIEDSASKNDQEKIDLSLIPNIALIEEAKAFMVGEKKYGRYNYTKGHKASQLVAAAMRHLTAWNEGEENDPKDGQHHLGSVRACCSMILRQMELGTLKDDRFKK